MEINAATPMDTNGHEARSRAAMHNRITCYEVIAELPGGAVLRLGFTARPSKMALLDMARKAGNVEKIAPHVTEAMPAKYTARGGWNLGAVKIRLSGRTERECAKS
jgi:hypothetical protein